LLSLLLSFLNHHCVISGPALGSALYIAGGFTLPYVVVSLMAFLVAIILFCVVPKVTTDNKSNNNQKRKSVTFGAIIKVCNFL
jgi:hypothetical protein